MAVQFLAVFLSTCLFFNAAEGFYFNGVAKQAHLKVVYKGSTWVVLLQMQHWRKQIRAQAEEVKAGPLTVDRKLLAGTSLASLKARLDQADGRVGLGLWHF